MPMRRVLDAEGASRTVLDADFSIDAEDRTGNKFGSISSISSVMNSSSRTTKEEELARFYHIPIPILAAVLGHGCNLGLGTRGEDTKRNLKAE